MTGTTGRHRDWFLAYTEGIVCITCGDPEMEWHHPAGRGPDDMPISTLVASGYSIARIIAEIQKCVPLCRTCHNRLHKSFDTQCRDGHALTGNNLYVRSNGRRQCRACLRRYHREYRTTHSRRKVGTR